MTELHQKLREWFPHYRDCMELIRDAASDLVKFVYVHNQAVCLGLEAEIRLKDSIIGALETQATQQQEEIGHLRDLINGHLPERTAGTYEVCDFFRKHSAGRYNHYSCQWPNRMACQCPDCPK